MKFLYQWQGIHISGSHHQGIFYHCSKKALKNYLNEKQIIPIHAKTHLHYGPCKAFSASTMSQVFLELSQLLKQGFSLNTALQLLVRTIPHQILAIIFSEIYSLIQQGHSLQFALQQWHFIFPAHFSTFAGIGEHAGQLPEALYQAATLNQLKINFQKKCKSRLSYPAFLALASLLTIYFLFTRIVPQFQNLLQTLHGQLPPLTRTILFVAAHLQNGLNISFLVFSLLLLVIKKCAILPNHIQSTLFKLPFISTLRRAYILGPWCRAMSMGLYAHCPLEQVLSLSQTILSNSSVASILNTIQQDILSGIALSTALQKSSFFLNKDIYHIQLAEERGTLPHAFEQLSITYQSEFESALQKIIQWIEPICIILVAFIIGIAMIAIYQPILQLGLAF